MALLNDDQLWAHYEPRIDAGVKVLNDIIPGWMDRIKLDTFYMGSTTECVLGQLYGDVFEGCKIIGLNPRSDDWHFKFRDLGLGTGEFYSKPASSYVEEMEWYGHACDVLTECWKKRIKEHQTQGVQHDRHA
jgi:hypothetical protein